MTSETFIEGAAFFVATAGCVWAGALIVVQGRLDHLTGAVRVLAVALVGSTGLLLVQLLPGLLGVLSRGSALACAVLALAAARWRLGRWPRAPAIPHRTGQGIDRASLVAAVGVAGGLVWALAAAWHAMGSASVEVDSLSFHLPTMVEWMQTGSVWRTDQFAPLLANGNYPQNGDLLLLSSVLPWHGDAFVRAAGLPFLGVFALSAYALSRELGVRRSAAAVGAVLLFAVPNAGLTTLEGARTDVEMWALGGAGLVFLVRHLRDRRQSSLVLAGLGLGLALGTKWYAAWTVVIWIGLWALAALYLGLRPRVTARKIVVLSALVLLGGSVWLLRNAILSGSPLYPTPVKIAGLTIFGAPPDYFRECLGFSIAHYLGQGHILQSQVWPPIRDAFGVPGLLLAVGWLGGVVALARGVRHGMSRTEAAGPALLLGSVPLLLAAYVAAPYSALGGEGHASVSSNVRWVVPALLPAAAVGAWCLDRLQRGRTPASLIALAGAALGLRAGFDVPGRVLAEALLATGVVGAGAWIASLRPAPLGMAVASVLLLAAVAYAVDRRQSYFYDHRYSDNTTVIRALARDHRHHRVGLAGAIAGALTYPALPAFGPNLDNHVAYVGHRVRGQLRRYGSRGAFLAAVRKGRFDVLVVGADGGRGCPGPGQAASERRWVRQAGFREVARSGTLSIFVVPGSGPRRGGPS